MTSDAAALATELEIATFTEEQLAALDPIDMRKHFEACVAKSQAATKSGGALPDLSPRESRAAIHLTRLLRRTNTGPARAKGAKKPKKAELTAAAIDSLMNDDI